MLARSENPSLGLNIPYSSAILPCGQKSESSLVCLMLRLFAQAFFDGTVSMLTPTAVVLRVSKVCLFFSRDFICREQTLVHASGWNDRSTFLSLKSESLNSFSFWSGRVKFLALSPTFGLSSIVFSPCCVFATWFSVLLIFSNCRASMLARMLVPKLA